MRESHCSSADLEVEEHEPSQEKKNNGRGGGTMADRREGDVYKSNCELFRSKFRRSTKIVSRCFRRTDRSLHSASTSHLFSPSPSLPANIELVSDHLRDMPNAVILRRDLIACHSFFDHGCATNRWAAAPMVEERKEKCRRENIDDGET